MNAFSLPHVLKKSFRLLIFGALLGCFNPGLGFNGRTPQAGPAGLQSDLQPLADYLLPDGSLDLEVGFSGSLDPGGYQMEYAPDGAPIFKPLGTAAGERAAVAGTWRALGSGVNNGVKAIAVAGRDVYVGGLFTSAGGVANTQYIAHWNGLFWSAMGSGMDDQVMAIAVAGSDVYAGGYFSTAGGVTTHSIARWDGSAWHALGGGFTLPVYAIAVSGTDVYVGGAFNTTFSGAVILNKIARWDGSAWNALGGGLDGIVNVITVAGADVYVGGNFTTANGNLAVNHVARWDGSSWYALGPGLNNEVRDIAVAGADVYVGGLFSDAGGEADADSIARWDGSQWHALGQGFANNVDSIVVCGADVYAGGSIPQYLSRWDGTQWNNIAVNGIVFEIAAAGPDIFVGGAFTDAGGVASTTYLARLDMSALSLTWDSLGNGLDGTVNAIAVAGRNVYVGGSFTSPCRVGACDYLARWTGTAWSNVGLQAPNGAVYAIAVAGPNVYVGGAFTNLGSEVASYIARFDGVGWHALGGSPNGSVFAIAISGPDVYVGGAFTTLSTLGGTTNRIARWDGAAWHKLGGGLNSTVRALQVAGADVYAGGLFTDAGGDLNADYIARWNGAAWSALGGGLNSTVLALDVAGANVYAGGNFTLAGGATTVNHIAHWDGADWHQVGSDGLNNYVSSLAIAGIRIYAGGAFTDADGNTGADHVAYWSTNQLFNPVWRPLGNGANGNVSALAVDGIRVLAGGAFTTAGTCTTGCTRIARYDLSSNADLSGLVLSSGTLSPAFSPGTTAYTASVVNSVTSLTVTPTAADPGAVIQIRVNGGGWSAVTSGSPSPALSLAAGDNPVEVQVIAADGQTTKTYTVVVNRVLVIRISLPLILR